MQTNKPINVSDILLLNAAVRMGGTAAVLQADMLLMTPPENRPEVLARAIMAGDRTAELASLVKTAKLPMLLANMVRDRGGSNG